MILYPQTYDALLSKVCELDDRSDRDNHDRHTDQTEHSEHSDHTYHADHSGTVSNPGVRRMRTV